MTAYHFSAPPTSFIHFPKRSGTQYNIELEVLGIDLSKRPPFLIFGDNQAFLLPLILVLSSPPWLLLKYLNTRLGKKYLLLLLPFHLAIPNKSTRKNRHMQHMTRTKKEPNTAMRIMAVLLRVDELEEGEGVEV